jgi:hypothetical protein
VTFCGGECGHDGDSVSVERRERITRPNLPKNPRRVDA